MKVIELNFKGSYKEAVEYVYKNFEVEEETTFTFTRVVRTNAKQRRCKKYKDVYEYEIEGSIRLSDNKHKENLFKKVCLPDLNNPYTTQEYFQRMGL